MSKSHPKQRCGGLALYCLCGVAAAARPAGTLVEDQTGAAFPAKVVIEDAGTRRQLSATGLAVRRKLIFDIYSMAHYLEDGPPGPRPEVLHDILSDSRAKQIILEFNRDLRAEQVRDGLTDSYAKAASPEVLRETQPLLQRFLQSIHKNVTKNERFTVRWLPGGRLQGVYDGQVVASVANPTFARTFWSMWFGDHPIVDRDALIRMRALLSRRP